MKGDIIEREGTVVFLTENEEVYSLKKESENILEVNNDIPDEIKEHIEKNTEFKIKSDLDYPLTFTSSHHLEDEVCYALEYEFEMEIDELLEKSLDLPSMEITENWKVDKKGNAELVSIEYNGKEYTKK